MLIVLSSMISKLFKLTSHDSTLIAPMGLIGFSIQISLFSKVKFTRTDMYSNSPLFTHFSRLTTQDYSLTSHSY